MYQANVRSYCAHLTAQTGCLTNTSPKQYNCRSYFIMFLTSLGGFYDVFVVGCSLYWVDNLWRFSRAFSVYAAIFQILACVLSGLRFVIESHRNIQLAPLKCNISFQCHFFKIHLLVILLLLSGISTGRFPSGFFYYAFIRFLAITSICCPL